MGKFFLGVALWGLSYHYLQAQIVTEELNSVTIPQYHIVKIIPQKMSVYPMVIEPKITQEQFLRLLSFYNKYQSGKVVYMCPPCKFPDIYLPPHLKKKFPDLQGKQIDWRLFDPFVHFLINNGFSSQKHLYAIINSFLS